MRWRVYVCWVASNMAWSSTAQKLSVISPGDVLLDVRVRWLKRGIQLTPAGVVKTGVETRADLSSCQTRLTIHRVYVTRFCASIHSRPHTKSNVISTRTSYRQNLIVTGRNTATGGRADCVKPARDQIVKNVTD